MSWRLLTNSGEIQYLGEELSDNVIGEYDEAGGAIAKYTEGCFHSPETE